MSFLEQAIQSFNAAAQSAQESSALTIDEGKTTLLAQARNAAVEQADTMKIDSTMALHHFGGKIVDFLDKYIDSDLGINDVVKRPARARENMEEDPDDPEAGTELTTITTEAPPPETPAPVADDPAVDEEAATTTMDGPEAVIPDAPVARLEAPDAPAAPAAAEEGLSEADLLPEGAGGLVGQASVRSLLTRPTRLVEGQQEASAGDPVVAPPPPPAAAAAGEAEAAAAEASAAAAESEEALAIL